MASIHSQLGNHATSHPFVATILGILMGLGTIFLVLQELFMPIGKRRAPPGKKWRLPPGPKGLPLFGSLMDLKSTRDDPDSPFRQSLTRYGEMTTLHLGSKTWVMLNSKRVVGEIIAKRGSLTNDRSPMPVASGIVSQHGRSLLLPTEAWTEKRRVMHSLLSGKALKQYATWQEQESAQLLAEYFYQPKTWFAHHFRFSNSVVHRIALGDRVVKTSRELATLQDVVTYFAGCVGTSLVDWFPEVDALPKPLHFWGRYWEGQSRWNYDVYRSWWDPVREKIDAGIAPPSFARDVLLHEDTKFTGDNQEAMYVAMQLMEAGSDTSRKALNIFVMSALCHPDVFEKARAEVDCVCAPDSGILRLPRIADMEQMPYICAIVKEVLRWRPMFPFIPDHVLTTDMEFEGYHFPAGVGFVINGIPVCDECEEPEMFKPERWLDGHEMDVVHGLWQFGGGRRICVGYRLAQRGLFINIARLVMCYNYVPDGPYDSHRLNHHLTEEPFPVKVTVRSEEHAKLIIEEATREGVLETAKYSNET